MADEKEKTTTEEKKDTPKSSDMAVEAKEDAPKPKEYTPEEIAEIAKKVETPSDQIPPYKPEYILSPEYGGTSNYENGIKEIRGEAERRLSALKNNPDATPQQIAKAEVDLKKLDHLYENFNIGMNVFRTAKGGRDKLRE